MEGFDTFSPPALPSPVPVEAITPLTKPDTFIHSYVIDFLIKSTSGVLPNVLALTHSTPIYERTLFRVASGVPPDPVGRELALGPSTDRNPQIPSSCDTVVFAFNPAKYHFVCVKLNAAGPQRVIEVYDSIEGGHHPTWAKRDHLLKFTELIGQYAPTFKGTWSIVQRPTHVQSTNDCALFCAIRIRNTMWGIDTHVTRDSDGAHGRALRMECLEELERLVTGKSTRHIQERQRSGLLPKECPGATDTRANGEEEHGDGKLVAEEEGTENEADSIAPDGSATNYSVWIAQVSQSMMAAAITYGEPDRYLPDYVREIAKKRCRAIGDGRSLHTVLYIAKKSQLFTRVAADQPLSLSPTAPLTEVAVGLYSDDRHMSTEADDIFIRFDLVVVFNRDSSSPRRSVLYQEQQTKAADRIEALYRAWEKTFDQCSSRVQIDSAEDMRRFGAGDTPIWTPYPVGNHTSQTIVFSGVNGARSIEDDPIIEILTAFPDIGRPRKVLLLQAGLDGITTCLAS